MNKFDCAFAHLYLNKNVDLKKCVKNYRNAYRGDVKVVMKNGETFNYTNMSINKLAKILEEIAHS